MRSWWISNHEFTNGTLEITWKARCLLKQFAAAETETTGSESKCRCHQIKLLINGAHILENQRIGQTGCVVKTCISAVTGSHHDKNIGSLALTR